MYFIENNELTEVKGDNKHIGGANYQSASFHNTSFEVNENTKYLCIAFHGYGQLAKYFIRDFESLGPEHVAIVPEGLHRFYREGMSGRVVASWMTANKYLIGDFSYADKIVTQGLGIEFFEQDSDNVRKNNITARVEAQIALACQRPDAFIYGDFTTTS